MDMQRDDIRADKKFLQDLLADFEAGAASRVTNTGDLSKKSLRLKAYIWKGMLAEELQGFDASEPAPFTYNKFWLELDDTAKKNGKHRENLLDLWKHYLETLKQETLDNDRKKKLHADMLARLEKIVPPTINGTANGSKPNASAATGFSSNGHNGAAPSGMGLGAGPSLTPGGPTGPVFAGYPSTMLPGNLLSLGVSFGTTYLMSSVSRAAICAAAGTIGLSGLPVMLLAGAGTGLFIGSFHNIAANWDHISAEANKQQGWKKTAAFVTESAKSVGWKQAFTFAVTGAAGGSLGFLAHEVAQVFSCMGELQTTNANLLSANEGLQSTLEARDATIAGLNTNIAGLNTQIDGLEGQLAAEDRAVPTSGPAPLNPTEVRVVMSPLDLGDVPASTPAAEAATIECPSYYEDCPESGILNISEITNGGSVPDGDALTPQNEKIVVASGDNLTKIVEEQYNIDELSTLDSDGDGIRDFDEVMAAVANENGLVGNQMNALRVDWELAMPDVNVADVSANIDRASLDSNWRSGEFVFSDVPQFKAA